ncbi:MAG TPA: DUF4168 domain-containing protein [Coleofasciculaceae cyanobacterium]|jgi:hypothetical protein
MMFKVNLTLFKLNKLYVRILSSSALALISLMVGLIPEISSSSGANKTFLPTVSLSSNAYGQQFTPEETENYARAGYQVELLRRKVYQEIKNLINEPPPNIVCDRQETLNNLKPQVREIANRYCNQSQQIVQQNNLTINRFNELKADYDRQASFYQQVQNILLKLQN